MVWGILEGILVMERRKPFFVGGKQFLAWGKPSSDVSKQFSF